MTVSLSGDGGDELFGGYTRYARGHRLWRLLRHVPRGLRAAIAPAFGRHYSRFVSARSAEDFYDFVMLDPAADGTVLGNRGQPPGASVGMDPGLADRDFYHAMMLADGSTYLPDDILVKVDRASMGVSLESRVPMLDHRVVELAWQMPLKMKVRNGEGKWILKQLLRKYVPAELHDRPKMGFGMPVGDWISGGMRDWAESLLAEERLRREGFLDVRRVRDLWSRHLAGRLRAGGDIWRVLMFQAWLAETATGLIARPDGRSPTIALFLPSLAGGGAERVFVGLANEFAARGLAVDLVLASREGPYLGDVSSAVRIVDLGSRRILRALPPLVRYLRSARPATLLSALDHANVIAVLARRLAGGSTRCVVSMRSVPTEVYSRVRSVWGRLLLRFIKATYRFADAIIANSHAVARDLSRVLGIPVDKISVIYNPLDLARIEAASREPLAHGWVAEGMPPVVLGVGSLTPLKDFAHAHSRVRDRPLASSVPTRDSRGGTGTRAPGGHGTGRRALADDVLMAGFVPNPFAWMRHAKVFVSSSLTEGCPNALMQALAVGTPIVSTDAPVVRRRSSRTGNGVGSYPWLLPERWPPRSTNASMPLRTRARERAPPISRTTALRASILTCCFRRRISSDICFCGAHAGARLSDRSTGPCGRCRRTIARLSGWSCISGTGRHSAPPAIGRKLRRIVRGAMEAIPQDPARLIHADDVFEGPAPPLPWRGPVAAAATGRSAAGARSRLRRRALHGSAAGDTRGRASRRPTSAPPSSRTRRTVRSRRDTASFNATSTSFRSCRGSSTS